jgi:hypothetical protein
LVATLAWFVSGSRFLAALVCLSFVAIPVSIAWLAVAGAIPLAMSGLRRPDRLALMLAVGLFVLLPGIYTPYLRLWLPGLALIISMLCGALQQFPDLVNDTDPKPVRGQRTFSRFVPGLLAMGFVLFIRMPTIPPDSRGYRDAVRQLIAHCHDHDIKQVLLYVRPPVLVYLQQENCRFEWIRLPDQNQMLDFVTWNPRHVLVTDKAVDDSTWFQESLRKYTVPRNGRHLRLVARFPVAPSLVTRLDDRQGRLDNLDQYSLRVYEFSDGNP